MTWEILASDLASGAGAGQGGRRLWLRDKLCYQYGLTWSFGEQASIASGSWITIISADFIFPKYFVSGDTWKVTVRAKGGGGGGTHQLRLQIGATTGTAVDVTNGANYNTREELSVTAASTPSGLTTVNIQGNDDAADSTRLQIKTSGLIWNCWYEAA